jgi:hypothetical protein
VICGWPIPTQLGHSAVLLNDPESGRMSTPIKEDFPSGARRAVSYRARTKLIHSDPFLLTKLIHSDPFLLFLLYFISASRQLKKVRKLTLTPPPPRWREAG